MAIERSELRLVWPPGIFAAEAEIMVAAGADDDALAGLLAEAFHGDRGERLLEQVAREQPYAGWSAEGDPWAVDGYKTTDPGPLEARATARLVTDLAREALELPRHVLRPLYRQRQQAQSGEVLSVADCKARFGKLVSELAALGYFEDAFGSQCCDAHDDPDTEGQRALAVRLELQDVPLWPPFEWSMGVPEPNDVPTRWTDEVFFDVVEALDELVARPRQRRWHDHHREWDYSDYSHSTGQAVYRWRVNELLDRSDVPLRLATTGDDAGLLVHSAGDPRDELIERVLATPAPTDRAEVRHAVSLFRGRSAGREDKRSAIFTLARLLEDRRPLVGAALTSKDEGALFRIANEFDLRHRRAAHHDKAQRADYDDAFLDWVFWWYLATVDLTDMLTARGRAAG